MSSQNERRSRLRASNSATVEANFSAIEESPRSIAKSGRSLAIRSRTFPYTAALEFSSRCGSASTTQVKGAPGGRCVTNRPGVPSTQPSPAAVTRRYQYVVAGASPESVSTSASPPAAARSAVRSARASGSVP
jgi:hypothetical protein